MKTVVLNKPKDIVNVDQVDEDKIYAGTISDSKFLIASEGYHEEFTLFSLEEGFTYCNGWKHHNNKSLKKCIEDILLTEDVVYEFKDFKEFCKWYLNS